MGGSGARAGNAGSFGAEGAGGVRDLGRAFTRAIPPACDADPLWKSAPAGDAGRIELSLEVDERGHVTGFEVETRTPPRALVSLARRTVAMLEAGTFALGPGGLARGSQRLEISARVSELDAEEEEAARSFGLRYTWEAGRGTASFTQVGGRRVDVSVRMVRVAVATAAAP